MLLKPLLRKSVRPALVTAGLVSLLGGAGGCAWHVIPPAEVREPVPVYLTDYGRHTRLALPGDRDVMHEYGFGEWHYYALEERGFLSTLRAVSGLGDAALAFRNLPGDEESFRLAAGGRRTARFEAEKDRVAELKESLEDKRRRGMPRQTYREWESLYFVPIDDSYNLFKNSNTKTARWLRRLDFDVRGHPFLSNFREADDSRTPPDPRTRGHGPRRR